MNELTMHYVSVGTRRVHYRRSGTGPALVLLHASPVSSAVFEPHMRLWSQEFSTIAIDTPGNGLSDPLELGRQPLIEDIADALRDTLDALGVEHCALYGRHTGASIAVEFVRRFPDRATLVVADGFPVFSPSVRDAYLDDYLSEVVPDWTGSHLLWWWFRYREQHVFWPWYKHSGANRADQDVPDLAFLHRGVKDILVAGNGYLAPYRAAFLHEGLPAIEAIMAGNVPVCFGARPGDLLFRVIDDMPEGAWTKEFPRDKIDAAMQELELFRQYPARAAPPPPPASADIAGRVTTDFLDVDGVQLATREFGAAHGGVPVVLIPQMPGSSRLLEPLMRDLGKSKHIVAFDLPGHGDSDPADSHSIEAYAGVLNRALSARGIDRAYLYGRNAGGSVAVELARTAPDRAASLMLEGPMILSERERQAMAPHWALAADPVWDGHHLTSLWHQLRDQQLFYPWYEQTMAASRFVEPVVTPEALHEQVVELIKHPGSYKPSWDAAFGYPLRERLAEIRRPVWIGASPADVFAPCLDTGARLLGIEAAAVSPSPGTAAPQLIEFLAQIGN